MRVRERLLTAPWFYPFRYVLSIVYGILVRLRNNLYDLGIFKIYKVKTPVISVGNISVGGSGKTVLVQALIEHFLSLNKKPAVLSRGYGRSTKGLVVVATYDDLKETALTAGDEPCLMAHNFPGVPIVVAEDRVVGAQYLEANFAPDMILLDDGFQHRRLDRDLNILIVDCAAIDQEHLLPRGRLREPSTAQLRADIILYSKAADQGPPARSLAFYHGKSVVDSEGGKVSLSELKGAIGVFAGIGNPTYFFSALTQRLGSLKTMIPFPDHTLYGPAEYNKILAAACDYWVTTQKDFIKLDPQFCRANNICYISLKTHLPDDLVDLLKQNFN